MDHSDFFLERRNTVNLSQNKIGEILGYSSQSVSAWESGRSFPDLSVWSKYASLLEVDLEGFINKKATKKNDRCEKSDFDADKFAKNLKYLRKKAGYTLSDLADILNVNTKTISAWEKGSSYPNLASYLKLCEIYKLKVDELYFVIKDEVVEEDVGKKKHKWILFSSIATVIAIAGVMTTVLLVNRNKTNNQRYEVAWANYDGTVIYKESYLYNELPTYKGEIPTKPSTLIYSYDFVGWDKDIVNVSSDVTYIATYQENGGEYIGGDGSLTIDYMIDEVNQDHIYDVNNPEGLSIILNNNDDLKVEKVFLKIDETSYEIDDTKLTQEKEVVTIDKSVFTSIYTSYGFSSFIQLTKIRYLDSNNQIDYAFTNNDMFLFGVVSSNHITYVNSYSDFFNHQDEYLYYVLNEDIEVTSLDYLLCVKGVIDGNGHSIGHASITKVDKVEGNYDYGIFSFFFGVIYDLDVVDFTVETKIEADNATHVASLFGSGEDFVLSNVRFNNVHVKANAKTNDTFASIVVACGVRASMEKVEIKNSSLIVNGDKSECHLSCFLARSSQSNNYSIRDSYMSDTNVYLSGTQYYSSISLVANTFVKSIKRVILYNNDIECVANKHVYFAGVIIEDGKEIEGVMFLKNKVNFDYIDGNKGIMSTALTDLRSCYYSSDNVFNYELSREEKDGILLPLEVDKTFYNTCGYRSVNWNLFNAIEEPSYIIPVLR